MIMADDTFSIAVYLDAHTFADIIDTSLSKMFSGACNMMGGSIVVNPMSRYANDMRLILNVDHIDSYSTLDAATMEVNSRDFVPRVLRATANAAFVAKQLRASSLVPLVYYPKGSQSVTELLRRVQKA